MRKDVNTGKYEQPKENFNKIYLESILQKEVEKSLYINRDDIVIKNDIVIENQLKPIRVGIVNKGGQGERIYSSKVHAITSFAYGGGVGAKKGYILRIKALGAYQSLNVKELWGLKIAILLAMQPNVISS